MEKKETNKKEAVKSAGSKRKNPEKSRVKKTSGGPGTVITKTSKTKEVTVIEPAENSGANEKIKVTVTASKVTLGKSVYKTFTVVDTRGIPVDAATIALSGAAEGGGVTDETGKVRIFVKAKEQGSITVTASKVGFADGTLTMTATPVQETPQKVPAPEVKPKAPEQPQLVVNLGPGESVLLEIGKKEERSVYVTDGNNTPVEGVSLKVFRNGSEHMPRMDDVTNSKGMSLGYTFVAEDALTTRKIVATKPGYTDGTLTLLATPAQETPQKAPEPEVKPESIGPVPAKKLVVTMDRSEVTKGEQLNDIVRFTVTDSETGEPVPEAKITLTGGATGEGTTRKNGSVLMIVTATSEETVNVTASKVGFEDGTGALTVKSAAPPRPVAPRIEHRPEREPEPETSIMDELIDGALTSISTFWQGNKKKIGTIALGLAILMVVVVAAYVFTSAPTKTPEATPGTPNVTVPTETVKLLATGNSATFDIKNGSVKMPMGSTKVNAEKVGAAKQVDEVIVHFKNGSDAILRNSTEYTSAIATGSIEVNSVESVTFRGTNSLENVSAPPGQVVTIELSR